MPLSLPGPGGSGHTHSPRPRSLLMAGQGLCSKDPAPQKVVALGSLGPGMVPALVPRGDLLRQVLNSWAPRRLSGRGARASSSLVVLLQMKTSAPHQGCPGPSHRSLSQPQAAPSAAGRVPLLCFQPRRGSRLSGGAPRLPIPCVWGSEPVTMPDTGNNALIVTAGPGSELGNVRHGVPGYHPHREQGWAPAHTKT